MSSNVDPLGVGPARALRDRDAAREPLTEERVREIVREEMADVARVTRGLIKQEAALAIAQAAGAAARDLSRRRVAP